jgi:glycosyltransferase involved in cell wall biosynthesis
VEHKKLHSMKKICFVVTSPLVANAFLPNHISVLQKKFDVYVVTNFFEGLGTLSLPQLDDQHTHHIKIKRNIDLISDVQALISLQKYFYIMKFDVVHSITPKAGLVAMLAARLAGVKNRVHIFTGQVWFTKKGLMKRFLIFFDKIIVKLSTHILVDGHSQRNFIIDNNVIKATNSQVFGKGSISGVDVLRFTAKPSIRQKIRKELLLLNNNTVFCFLGRINVDKGVLDFANAFKMLLEDYPETKILIIGYDEENLIPQIKAIIGENDSLIYYGPTSTPENVLQAADVLCLPSYREGFGTSVLEASLLGLPIICSDTYGLMDTIIENETGLRHKVGDMASLSIQMKKLIESPDFRKYLGDNGRKYVLENFSASTISNYWLDFYIKNFIN